MIALALAGVAAMAGTASASAAAPASAPASASVLAGHRAALTAPPVSVALAGSFDFHACPAGTPAADACLTDHVTGALPGIGAVTGTFEVHIGYSAFAADGCGPIEKHGTFTAVDGSTVRLAAHGLYCNASATASYTYTVSGGTRSLAHASGRGQWLVPAPATYSDGVGTGAEYLFGTLHR